MGYLSGWSYYKVISLTGQTGAGTLYQVELDIGASAGGDFHLEGNCTNFPQDIEVTDNDGTTLLNFHIEDTSADPIKMTVKVADDLGSNQTIWVYYGKSGETTPSNGTNTFLSFFDGSSTGWTEVDPNSHISFANNRLEWAGLDRDEDAYVYQSASVNGDITIEYTYAITSFTDTGYVAIGVAGDMVDDYNNLDNGIQSASNYFRNSAADNASSGKRVSDVSSNGGDIVIIEDTQYWVRTTIDRSGNCVTKIYSNAARTSQVGSDSTLSVTDVTATLQYMYLIASLNTAQGGREISGWVDDFRVRKYNSPEPAFSSAGAEQSVPGVGNPYWYYQMLRRRN